MQFSCATTSPTPSSSSSLIPQITLIMMTTVMVAAAAAAAFVLPPQMMIFFNLPPISIVCIFLISSSLLVTHHFYPRTSRRRIDKRRRRLPPGSLGWPYIGETLKLYTENPNSFFSIRQKRYGSVFKTHILGCPCVMISSPEAAKEVLVSQAHLFKPTYPPSKQNLIGPEALFFHQGVYHASLKKLVQASFLPSAIKGLVPEIEDIILDAIPTWESNNSINTLQEMKRYAFEVAMISAFGHTKDVDEVQGIKVLYHDLEKGYNSMPLNFPGMPFHRAMKARKLLTESLKREIQKRRDSKQHGGGLLGEFIRASSRTEEEEEENQETKRRRIVIENMSDSQIADNIIGVIFAAHDTTATALTWLLKYLHDHPLVLHALTMEQEEIRSKRFEEGNRGLTWEDTRRMPLTSRVIQETLRSASILSFTFREAVEDVEFDGFVIPKGWKVLPLFRTIHHCPDFFPDPEKFDPSRFEVPPRPNTYMPFGKGVHSCPGSELAKLEMLILLHHLTTTYRWKVIGDGEGVEYVPFPVPRGGLPITVHKRKTTS